MDQCDAPSTDVKEPAAPSTEVKESTTPSTEVKEPATPSTEVKEPKITPTEGFNLIYRLWTRYRERFYPELLLTMTEEEAFKSMCKALASTNSLTASALLVMEYQDRMRPSLARVVRKFAEYLIEHCDKE